MISKQEIIALWTPDVPPKAIKMINRLWAEREAYREVAIGEHNGYDGICSRCRDFDNICIDEQAKNILNAEARKIIDAQKEKEAK